MRILDDAGIARLAKPGLLTIGLDCCRDPSGVLWHAAVKSRMCHFRHELSQPVATTNSACHQQLACHDQSSSCNRIPAFTLPLYKCG